MDEEGGSSNWTRLIENHWDDRILRSRTCHIHNRRSKQPANNSKQRCPCGRLIGRHSLDGSCLESQTLDRGERWTVPKEFYDNKTHSCPVTVKIYGILEPYGCKFLRMDSRFNGNTLTELSDLYHLILEDCNGKKPGLVLSVSGGAKYFTLSDRLQTDVVRDLIDIAARAEAWILTDGVNTGMSKFVGEGISHSRLLHRYSDKIKCIGLTMWGTITENARLSLKRATKGYREELLDRQIPSEQDEEDKSTVELNHTHCILFDSGRLDERLSDSHRNQFVATVCHDVGPTCYALTIMFGGDLNDLQLLENDIKHRRPIILVQGSGRLTDMLASLYELTSNSTWNEHWNPSEREIRTAFDIYFTSYTDAEATASLKQIRSVLDRKNRYLLSVFCFDRDSHVTRAVFNAILSATRIGKTMDNSVDLPEVVRRFHENRLLDLAFDWNYIEGATPIVQRWQDEMLNKKQHLIETHAKRETELFRKSLENNRPTFIDFFLSAGFDPRDLSRTKRDSECEETIWDLYNESRRLMSESHQNRVTALFGSRSPRSKGDLHQKLQRLVGVFVGAVDTSPDKNNEEHTWTDCCRQSDQYGAVRLDLSLDALRDENTGSQSNIRLEYRADQMLRDLFLWAIFMDMPDMAKVLLVHVQSRICAALVASAVFKQYAKLADTIDLKESFCAQALDFETYAANCIDQCYKYNERTACELLLRQVPLFGFVTCMQVAISSKSEKLLRTACFDQALTLVWHSRLTLLHSEVLTQPLFLLSVALLGFPAPLLMNYRKKEKRSTCLPINERADSELSPEGIDYYLSDESSDTWSCRDYWLRFQHFHQSPMMKMCYHFVSYAWFLLVFSYMMLYEFDNNITSKTHWTEVYVIVTVTTMLFEEVRETVHDYNTQMLELLVLPRSPFGVWLTKASTILPYVLFYLALAIQFVSKDNDDVTPTARIIMALDLEIWYLQSFKFAMALKFLGPKLVMLKNMLRDLFAFVYMIFVAIIAYGVVSRSLIWYKQVPFTMHGIFKNIFYDSYWFLYQEVSDKDDLDARVQNTTSKIIAEATATEVLLTFHMLFINILLINLLIAVFADSIGKVQQNTEFYWRYQRYSFVREYFQRPIFAYSPLILIPHSALLVCAIKDKFCSTPHRSDATSMSQRWTPIFKMIAKKDSRLNEHWDMFENAATHSYAQSILEQNKHRNTLNNDDNPHQKPLAMMYASSQTSKSASTMAENEQAAASMKEELATLKSTLSDMQQDLHKIIASQQLVTETISHFKLTES